MELSTIPVTSMVSPSFRLSSVMVSPMVAFPLSVKSSVCVSVSVSRFLICIVSRFGASVIVIVSVLLFGWLNLMSAFGVGLRPSFMRSSCSFMYTITKGVSMSCSSTIKMIAIYGAIAWVCLLLFCIIWCFIFISS